MPPLRRLSPEEMAELAAQVAALAAAGLPLAPGLRAVAKELRGSRVARVLDRVAAELDDGKPLEEALAAQPSSVPPHLVSLILAGTKSGRLAAVLQCFVETERNRIELRRRIWANLAYPLLLVLMVLVLLGLCVHWVIPQMAAVYAEAANLSQAVGETADNPFSPTIVGTRFLLWLACSLLSVVLLLWGMSRLGLPAPWLRLVGSVPIVGPIWTWSQVLQFCRLMEVLVHEAIPLPDALRMTGDAIRDPRLAAACREAASRIEGGSSLSQSMAGLPPFPPTLLPFIEWGQATNNLGAALRGAAEAFEERVQAQVALLRSILMPAAFLLVVGAVLFLMVSYVAPVLSTIFSLTGAARGPQPGRAGPPTAGDPLLLLGGFGPLIFGLAVLMAMRILSDRHAPAVRDATQEALYIAGCTLVAVGVLGTLALCLGIVFALVAAIVAGLAVFRRRRAQQYALVGLLAASAERLMPLVPALEAFSREYRGSIGVKALRLSDLFRSGHPLPSALAKCYGLLPRETIPMVRTGYESGALATALRRAQEAHDTHEPMLNEVLTRIAYLAGLLAVFEAVSAFILIKIMPAMQKIFMDFGATLPEPTRLAITLGYCCLSFAPILWPLPTITGVILVYTVLRYVGLVEWRFPGASRFLRKLDRAAILEALSVAIDRRCPVPVSMRTLAESYPSASVRARLRRSLSEVEGGVPWSQSLCRHGLLGPADLAVLDAAARVGNLPWAMREMADSNRRRWVYRARMWLQALFPLAILCVSLVISLYVVGYFLPLVRLIEGLL